MAKGFLLSTLLLVALTKFTTALDTVDAGNAVEEFNKGQKVGRQEAKIAQDVWFKFLSETKGLLRYKPATLTNYGRKINWEHRIPATYDINFRGVDLRFPEKVDLQRMNVHLQDILTKIGGQPIGANVDAVKEALNMATHEPQDTEEETLDGVPFLGKFGDMIRVYYQSITLDLHTVKTVCIDPEPTDAKNLPFPEHAEVASQMPLDSRTSFVPTLLHDDFAVDGDWTRTMTRVMPYEGYMLNMMWVRTIPAKISRLTAPGTVKLISSQTLRGTAPKDKEEMDRKLRQVFQRIGKYAMLPHDEIAKHFIELCAPDTASSGKKKSVVAPDKTITLDATYMCTISANAIRLLVYYTTWNGIQVVVTEDDKGEGHRRLAPESALFYRGFDWNNFLWFLNPRSVLTDGSVLEMLRPAAARLYMQRSIKPLTTSQFSTYVRYEADAILEGEGDSAEFVKKYQELSQLKEALEKTVGKQDATKEILKAIFRDKEVLNTVALRKPDVEVLNTVALRKPDVDMWESQAAVQWDGEIGKIVMKLIAINPTANVMAGYYYMFSAEKKIHYLRIAVRGVKRD